MATMNKLVKEEVPTLLVQANSILALSDTAVV